MGGHGQALRQTSGNSSRKRGEDEADTSKAQALLMLSASVPEHSALQQVPASCRQNSPLHYWLKRGLTSGDLMNMRESPSPLALSSLAAVPTSSWFKQSATHRAASLQKRADNCAAAAVAVLLMLLAVLAILLPSLVLRDLTLTATRNDNAPLTAQQVIERF